MTIELGYWKIRGLVAGCEMLCELVEQPYKTTKYEVFKKENDTSSFPWDRSAWFDVKYKLGIQIPNLPYAPARSDYVVNISYLSD